MTDLKSFQAGMKNPTNISQSINLFVKENKEGVTLGIGVLAAVSTVFFLASANSSDNQVIDPAIICGKGAEGSIIAFDLETGNQIKHKFVSVSNDDLPYPPIDSLGVCTVDEAVGHVVPLGNVNQYLQMHHEGFS